jgi:hypothetical protein
VHDVLGSPGQPLPPATRAFFEPRFGHDFGGVRVHTDGQAAESARGMNAAAYTLGRDVVFGADQYAPETGQGRKLIAHELAHVVQQGDSHDPLIQRQTLASPRLKGNSRFDKLLHNRDVIKLGDTGPEVRRIQQLLIDLGIAVSGKGANGHFDPETETAVRQFQHAQLLTEDGKVGFKTIAALDSTFPAFALPATKSAAWTMSCVLGILCPWNKNLVVSVLPTKNIITFDSRDFPTERWDGATWVAGSFHSGGFTSGNNLGFLNTTSCEDMALTIYHEGWHAQQPAGLTGVVDTEKDAYINTEQWSIAAGIPGQTFNDTVLGTTRGLRTTRNGETVVDESAAETLVRQGYGGVSATPGERVLSRVGADQVRVRRPNGSEYTRAAQVGDSVRGAVTMTNQHTIDPTTWVCPP